MSEEITLTASTLPQDFCPATEQERIDQFAASLSVLLPDYYSAIVISSSTPGAADQDKLWIKLDGSGGAIGAFVFIASAWVQVDAPNVWVKATAGAADTYTATIANYPLSTGPRDNDVFLLKISATNTGASTLNLNATGAKAIKTKGNALWAGALEANKWYTFVYDGTNYEVTAIREITAGTITAGTDGQFLRTRSSAATWESHFESGETAIPAAGNKATFTHGLTSVPIAVEVRLRCTDAGGDLSYAENDEVSIESAYYVSGSNEDPAFAIQINGTAVYAVRNSDVATIILPNASTGSPAVAITEAKWALVCYAIR